MSKRERNPTLGFGSNLTLRDLLTAFAVMGFEASWHPEGSANDEKKPDPWNVKDVAVRAVAVAEAVLDELEE